MYVISHDTKCSRSRSKYIIKQLNAEEFVIRRCNYSQVCPHRYDALEFPRCSLSMDVWVGVLVEGLGHCGVRVRVVRVSGDPTPQDAHLKTLIKAKLEGHFIR